MTEGWYKGFHYVIDSDRMEPLRDGSRFWAKLDSLYDERPPDQAVRVEDVDVRETYGEDEKEAVAKAEIKIKLAIDTLAHVK